MVSRFTRHFGAAARQHFSMPESDRSISVINPMLGQSLSEDEIIAALEPLGWRRPPDTGVTSTNCRLNDLGVYMHHRRHGFHPYAFEIAEQLRHGLITREAAQAKLAAIPERADIDWLAERLELDPDAP